jgi:butyrate kinase
MVVGEGGFVSFLGTNSAQEVENLAASGHEKSRFYQEALFYQVAKSIGEMAVVLEGKVDGIILTGGMAHNKTLGNYMNQKVGFIAPIFIYPGEDELEALAMNALLVARGEVVPKEYKKQGI